MSSNDDLVVFLCPGRYSVGEIHNAIVISRQVAAAGYRTLFIVTDRLLPYALASATTAVAHSLRRGREKATHEFLEALAPRLVVAADYHLPFLEPGSASLDDLIPEQLPRVDLDSLGFGATGAELDTAIAGQPGAEAIARWFAPHVSIPAARPGLRLAQPSPVATPMSPAAFSLYSDRPTARAEGHDVRSRFGVQAGRKMVVIAQSAWAATAFTQLGRSRGRQLRRSYDSMRVEWIVSILEMTELPITVVGVQGPRAFRSGGVDFITTPHAGIDDFTDLLSAADLYVTDNILSSAMARAAMMGRPCLALDHTGPDLAIDPSDDFEVEWHTAMSADFPGYDFPFRVNPLGWCAEVEVMSSDNAYLQAVPRAPLYERRSVAAGAFRQLSDDCDLSATEALDSSLTVLPDALEALGLNHRALRRRASAPSP